MRVSMVCLGNICRSPIAEAVLRARLAEAGLAEQVTVESAGTGGWHVGSDADPRSLQVLARAGYPVAHSARRFVAADFARLDLVVAMDTQNLADLRALAPDAASQSKVTLLRGYDPDAEDHEVPDPYLGGPQGFAETLAMVEAACDGLVEHLRERLDSP